MKPCGTGDNIGVPASGADEQGAPGKRILCLDAGKVKESSRHVEAALKALGILECFQTEPLLSLKNIREMTGLNISRMIRLCGTQVAKGYLAYDSGTRHYKLGNKILPLSKAYEHSNNLISLSRPVLRNLADQTGESATLFIVDGLQRLCPAREEGTFSLRYNILEGQRKVLYAGAGGKVLLAFGPEELRRKVLSRDHLRKLTPATIQDPKRLQKELETVRWKGDGRETLRYPDLEKTNQQKEEGILP